MKNKKRMMPHGTDEQNPHQSNTTSTDKIKIKIKDR